MKFNIKINHNDYLMILIVILTAIWSYNNVNEFKSLPAPLFGGDYYYQLGQIHHMYEAPINEWFSSSNGLGERPGYFPVYGILITIFGKILGLTQIQAFLYSNIFLVPLSLIIFYFFLKEFFKDNSLALSGTILFSFNIYPFILKYTEFTKYIMFPLFLLFLLKFFTKKNYKNAIILGLVYGIFTLSHATSIIIGTLLIMFLLIYDIYIHYKKTQEITTSIKNNYFYLIVLLIGLTISQIYWFEPIFIYHLKSGLKSYLWSLPDYSNTDYAIKLAIDMIKDYLLNFKNIEKSITSLLTLFGIFYLIKNENNTFILIVLGVSVFITFSYLITAPLFDIHFLPEYMNSLYLSTIVVIISTLGLKITKKWKKFIPYIMFLIFLHNIYIIQENLDNNKYVDFSKSNPVFPRYIALRSYLLTNTSYNDVILSNNELSFVINALSGRKLVISRRAQNDGFMQDFDKRQMDVAIILYGNDTDYKRYLIKKYNISYIYFDNTWKQLEYKNDDLNNLAIADPLMVLDTEENREYLDKYGVKYMPIFYYLDPSVRGPEVRRFNVLIITQENYETTGLGIWKNDIDAFLEPVWVFKSNDVIVSVLYKIKENI